MDKVAFVLIRKIIRPMKNFILLFFIAFVGIGCKTKSLAVPPQKESVTSDKLLYDALNKKNEFESLKITSKINAEIGTFLPPIDAVFYIEKSQKIWINFQVFINVGRALITPSGLKAYEKWDKTYVDSDFSYLKQKFNANFLDYASLENLLLGKTFFPINETFFQVTQNENKVLVNSSKNIVLETDGNAREYKISLEYSKELDLKVIHLEEYQGKKSFDILYENYEKFFHLKLPKSVKIIIKGDKTKQILIENTKFEFLKMETPFSIPANYTKTEIK